MLNIRLNILIILLFIISCSGNEDLIIGDWSLSHDFISKNVSFKKNLDKYHEIELNEKFSNMLETDVTYSFKNDLSINLVHIQNNEMSSLKGVWSINDDEIKIDIDGQSAKVFKFQVDDSKLILQNSNNEKIIFYKK